jgi:Fe2+ transport system protein FeoA
MKMDFNSSAIGPGDTAHSVTLADLGPGARAVVERVDPGLPIGRRLLDLGFVKDTEIRVLRSAPLGDPVSYEIRGTRLCLRRRDARQVWVRILPEPVQR